MNARHYLILAILWLIYFFLHSLLATDFAKHFFKRVLGTYFQYYRLLYTAFSILTLLPVLYYNAIISSEIIILNGMSEINQFIGLIFATYGIIIMKRAFKNYPIREFLGLKVSENATEPLRTDGILQYIRHPLYAGTILIFIGFWFFAPTLANLITVVMAITYIFVGIKLEEAKLLKTYGRSYEEYKKRVPMLIPSFRRRR